jgi:hypothetical protein
MDLLKTLDERIHSIPKGDHTSGLYAVRTHIDSAMRHLARGNKENDQSAFIDAIYRCNQAFEGSVKEAYRVLTGENPDRRSPNDIEKYLASENLLRHRVLAQLKIYRQEWRNPSTHDYKLDFDDDEALLAIASVAAFAIVLCDQISEKIAFDATQLAVKQIQDRTDVDSDLPILERVAAHVQMFANTYRSSKAANSNMDISQIGRSIEAWLGGFLAAAMPEAKVVMHPTLGEDERTEVDIAILGENAAGFTDIVAVELKFGRRINNQRWLDDGTTRALRILQASHATGVVLTFLDPTSEDHALLDSDFGDSRLKIVRPLSSALS